MPLSNRDIPDALCESLTQSSMDKLQGWNVSILRGDEWISTKRNVQFRD